MPQEILWEVQEYLLRGRILRAMYPIYVLGRKLDLPLEDCWLPSGLCSVTNPVCDFHGEVIKAQAWRRGNHFG